MGRRGHVSFCHVTFLPWFLPSFRIIAILSYYAGRKLSAQGSLKGCAAWILSLSGYFDQATKGNYFWLFPDNGGELFSTAVIQLEPQVPSTALSMAACVSGEHATPTGSSVTQESGRNAGRMRRHGV